MGGSDEPPRCPWRSAFLVVSISRNGTEWNGTEQNGTERNARLFHGTDKCDNGTINLILEYLTRNGSI